LIALCLPDVTQEPDEALEITRANHGEQGAVVLEPEVGLVGFLKEPQRHFFLLVRAVLLTFYDKAKRGSHFLNNCLIYIIYFSTFRIVLRS
jgi:hypothetical protein